MLVWGLPNPELGSRRVRTWVALAKELPGRWTRRSHVVSHASAVGATRGIHPFVEIGWPSITSTPSPGKTLKCGWCRTAGPRCPATPTGRRGRRCPWRGPASIGPRRPCRVARVACAPAPNRGTTAQVGLLDISQTSNRMGPRHFMARKSRVGFCCTGASASTISGEVYENRCGSYFGWTGA